MELADGRVTFGPPKSASGRRTVALPADLIALIEDHLNDHVSPEPDALLFTSPEGHPLRRSKFRHRWAAACGGVGSVDSICMTFTAAVLHGPPQPAQRSRTDLVDRSWHTHNVAAVSAHDYRAGHRNR